MRCRSRSSTLRRRWLIESRSAPSCSSGGTAAGGRCTSRYDTGSSASASLASLLAASGRSFAHHGRPSDGVPLLLAHQLVPSPVPPPPNPCVSGSPKTRRCLPYKRPWRYRTPQITKIISEKTPIQSGFVLKGTATNDIK